MLPAFPTMVIQSSEGAQQGDLPVMLLFLLSYHELLRELAEFCDLPLTVVFADDVELAGTLPEILNAVLFLHTAGTRHQFFINLAKTRLLVPSPHTETLMTFSSILSRRHISAAVKYLLGNPIGTQEYVQEQMAKNVLLAVLLWTFCRSFQTHSSSSTSNECTHLPVEVITLSASFPTYFNPLCHSGRRAPSPGLLQDK